jgi:hypothetical protein
MVDALINRERGDNVIAEKLGFPPRRERKYETPELFLRFLQNPSVGELMKHITARLSNEGIAVPDWWNSARYWHELLYDLQKQPDAPESLKKEFFESDGPYLKSVTVKEYLLPMMAHLCLYVGDRTEIMDKYQIEFSLVDITHTPKEYRDFLDKAVALAKERFAPLQDDVQIRLR